MNRRVHEIARDLGVTSRTVIEHIRGLGEFVVSASSTVAEPIARRVYADFRLGVEASRDDHSIGARLPTTPPTTLTWQANPVKEPTTGDVVYHVEKLHEAFPESRVHRNMLRALGSQFVYADLLKMPDGRHCGLALVRFSGAVESAFGLTREVVFFYAPYRDLQIRTFMLAKEKLAAMKREVTPDLVFFSSPDDRLTERLKDWSSLQFMAIPLPTTLGDEPISLINQLRDQIYARDLFYETTPVSGDKFFGRATLLQELRDDIANQRASGLFGLRKSGKTSILQELRESLASEHLMLIFIDLETLPSPPIDPTPDFVRDIASRVSAGLAKHGLRCRELERVAKDPSVGALKPALDVAVQKLQQKGKTLVLLLDEIEFLTPSDQVDTQEAEFPALAQALASLRAVAQSNANFTFILAGLTNHILENGRLYGRPNPLFSWAKARYVGPLSRREADNLATTLGARMGIEIDDGALEALYEASGGHAYLYRNLASEVVGTLPMETYRRIMRRPDVQYQLTPWKRGIAGNVEEMINHLTRYYPTEGVLLEILKESPADFAELANDEHKAIHHLSSLGLISERSGSFELNVLLELI